MARIALFLLMWVASLSIVAAQCPAVACPPPPWKCPAGFHVGKPSNASSSLECHTLLCDTCVSDASNTLLKEVPICFQQRWTCFSPVCPDGFNAIAVQLAGKDGAAPCCPSYECRRECPDLRCSDAPWKCPNGSSVATPRYLDDQCNGCPTCVDGEGVPVIVPPCYRTRSFCDTPTCEQGKKAIIVEDVGEDGERPCCPTYSCEPICQKPTQCPSIPRPCPKGTIYGLYVDDYGCEGCPSCLRPDYLDDDDNTIFGISKKTTFIATAVAIVIVLLIAVGAIILAIRYRARLSKFTSQMGGLGDLLKKAAGMQAGGDAKTLPSKDLSMSLQELAASADVGDVAATEYHNPLFLRMGEGGEEGVGGVGQTES